MFSPSPRLWHQKQNRPWLGVATGRSKLFARWLCHQLSRAQVSPGRSSRRRSPDTGAPATV